MLPLLERVVGHLERVQRVAGKEVVDGGVALDHDRFEAYELGLYDRVTERLARHLGEDRPWSQDYRRAFVEELHWLLLDGIGARWSAEERAEFIEAGITRRYARHRVEIARPLDPARSQLLVQLLDRTGKDVWLYPRRGESPGNVAMDYCNHLGLCSPTASVASVSPAGTILLRLRGIDRLRWLLALETSLATSNRDSWCVDIGSVRRLATGKEWWFSSSDPEGHLISDATFERWTELGALEREDLEYGAYYYTPTPVGDEIFGELARDEATSFRTMVRAMLEDERAQAFPPVDGTHSPEDRATAATLRHARMVAHEVRNTLLPVQHALKKIWESPTRDDGELAEYRRRIDEGMNRLYRFIDESVRLTPIAAEEATTFTIMEVIDEARRQCVPAPQGGIVIETIPANANPRSRGHQGRLVLALLNLLRNAVQIGGIGVRITISVDARSPRTTIIRVHDDGPGIPDEQRETLFQDGISHRDGGSGHGLSLVRSIIESEMGGRVQLVATKDDTGACFEIELPTEEEES